MATSHAEPETNAETVDVPVNLGARRPRSGRVFWYRWNGSDFAVREGTVEHELLVRANAPEIDAPDGPAAA